MGAVPGVSGAFRSAARRSRLARNDAIWFYVFILPWLLGFAFLSVFPLIMGFISSFSNYDGGNLAMTRLVGLANYRRALRDEWALHGLVRTLAITTTAVPITQVVAFVFALVLNLRVPARKLLGALVYIPSILPVVAAVWVWKMIWEGNFGLLNAVVSLLRPGTAIKWLVEYPTEMLVAFTVWQGIGGVFIFYLAGLQGIRPELEEAALIDGANRLQVCLHITTPLMTPIIFFQSILGVIWGLQTFLVPVLLGSGGLDIARLQNMPPEPNRTYMVNVWQVIFSRSLFGYGAALIWLLFLLILLITLAVFRTQKYWVYYEE